MQHVVLGQKVIALKNEADFSIAQRGQLPGVQAEHVLSVQRIAAPVGGVHTPDDVHQCGFAAAGCTQNRDELAGLHGKAYLSQHLYPLFTYGVAFVDILQPQHITHTGPPR